MRESGIQAAEAIVAGGAAGAAAAVRSVSEAQTMLALRGGGDWLDRTLRIPRRPPGLAPPPNEVPAPQIIGRPLLERAGQRAAEVERAAAQDIESFASQQVAEAEAAEGFASAAEVATAGAEAAAAAEGGGMLAALGEGALAVAGTVGAAAGGLAVAGAGAAIVGTAGPSRQDLMRRPTCGVPPPEAVRIQRRLAALSRHRRADFERNAGKRGHRPLLRAGAAAPPTAASLQDRHDGVRGRAPAPTPATNPSAPREAPQSAAHALRHQSGPHPRVLG